MRQTLALFQHQFLEFLDPQILNQELDARAAAILLFAQARENAGDRLRQRQQFFRRNKRVEQLRLIRDGAEPAADGHFKAALLLSVFDLRDGDHAHVVHARESAGMLRAAAEGRLEFPSEILGVRMAHQEFGQGAGVGRDVELFIRADARVGASRHVAHGISAGLARGDVRGGQAAHHAGRILDVDVVKLEILPRGHVRDAVGILLGQVRQRLELPRVQSSRGNLDALHPGSIPHRIRALGQISGGIFKPLNGFAVVPLSVVITLAVDSSAKARFGKEALVNLALLSQGDFRLEDIYFTGQTLRHFPGESFSPKRVRDLHLALPPLQGSDQPAGAFGLLDAIAASRSTPFLCQCLRP